MGLLDLSVEKPRMSAGLEDIYQTLEAKSAALAVAIIRNHPFIDANKRTGILAGAVMLMSNGRDIVASPDALYEVAIRVEAQSMQVDDLTAWMNDWNNVLPVTRDEWELLPQLFDPSPWDDAEVEEE